MADTLLYAGAAAPLALASALPLAGRTQGEPRVKKMIQFAKTAGAAVGCVLVREFPAPDRAKIP